MKYKKIYIVLLMSLLLLLSFFVGSEYGAMKENEEIKNRYINTVTTKIAQLAQSMQYTHLWNQSLSKLDATNPYRQMMNDINEIKVISQNFKKIEKNKSFQSVLGQIYQSMRFLENAMDQGIIHNDMLICNSFLQDQVLSQNEIAFINVLGDSFKDLERQLIDQVTRNPNSKLTYQQLHDLFLPFTKKYCSQQMKNIGLKN